MPLSIKNKNNDLGQDENVRIWPNSNKKGYILLLTGFLLTLLSLLLQTVLDECHHLKQITQNYYQHYQCRLASQER